MTETPYDLTGRDYIVIGGAGYIGSHVCKTIHVELTNENILCQKIKSSDYRAATLARSCTNGGNASANAINNFNFN